MCSLYLKVFLLHPGGYFSFAPYWFIVGKDRQTDRKDIFSFSFFSLSYDFLSFSLTAKTRKYIFIALTLKNLKCTVFIPRISALSMIRDELLGAVCRLLWVLFSLGPVGPSREECCKSSTSSSTVQCSQYQRKGDSYSISLSSFSPTSSSLALSLPSQLCPILICPVYSTVVGYILWTVHYSYKIML